MKEQTKKEEDFEYNLIYMVKKICEGRHFDYVIERHCRDFLKAQLPSLLQAQKSQLRKKVEELLEREQRYLKDARERNDEDEMKDGRATTQTLEEVLDLLK